MRTLPGGWKILRVRRRDRSRSGEKNVDEEEETEARAIEKAQFRPYLFIVFVDFHFSMGTS